MTVVPSNDSWNTVVLNNQQAENSGKFYIIHSASKILFIANL